MELFQRVLGDGKIPDEKDPNRDKWLKEMQDKLAAEAQKEAKAELEKPVSDKDGQWMYVIPEPGFCIKCTTLKTKMKVFINICKHERIAEPIPLEPDEQEEGDAIKFKIPLSCGQARTEKDKAGQPCKVYDVIVNPTTVQRCAEDAEFRRFVAALCMTWIKQKSEPDLNADEFNNLNFKAKGVLEAQRIRLSAQPKPANALGDEIQLPNKCSATAPPQVGGRSGGTKSLVEEITPAPQKKVEAVSFELQPNGQYDWSRHAKAARHPHFRDNVPAEYHLVVTIPVITTIKEVDVQVVRNRKVEFTYVDEEGAPFLVVPLPYHINETPAAAKFIKAKKELRLTFTVELQDETDASAKTQPSRDAEELEREEKAKAEAEQERKLAEQRERLERIAKDEQNVMSQRKEYVENIAALQEGAIPPVIREEFEGMSREQQHAMLLRLEGKIKRGDSVDQLLEKLSEDVLTSICRFLRDKLGLEQRTASAAQKAPKKVSFDETGKRPESCCEGQSCAPQSGTTPWEAKLNDTTENVEYNFAKKAEKLFGVLMNNRYIFALDQ